MVFPTTFSSAFFPAVTVEDNFFFIESNIDAAGIDFVGIVFLGVAGGASSSFSFSSSVFDVF